MLLAACASAPRPDVRAVDRYGTTRLTADELRRALEPTFDRYLVAEKDEERKSLSTQLKARLVELGFAWGRVSRITYFRQPKNETYVTIDVVEPADRERRMPFAAAPDEDLADVDGLAAAWNAYEAKALQLLTAHALPNEYVPCNAFHCLVGFRHPDLASYGKLFDEKVPARRAELIALLHRAKDEDRRAAAAYLIAHLQDGNEVVAELMPALRDPSSAVRNNAMRVLQDIAHHHPEIAIPVEPVFAALDYPETTDRNKALAIVDGLADRPENAAAIRAHGRLLVALLALEQPNNHDFAYGILKKVSGQDFGERDVAAWERWLATPPR
jgi:hypothetical protein